jgi:phosphohistidine phosphatase
LTGSGARDARARLEIKYPTAALAILRAPVMHWRDLGVSQCELVSFTTSRAIGTACD